MIDKIKNLTGDLLKFATSDFSVVSSGVYAERFSICSDCKHYDSKYGRCNECGCQINYKAQLASSACPLHFWGSVADSGNIQSKGVLSIVPSIVHNLQGGCGGCKKNVGK